MKIGITCYPTYGGSGVVATELGKALAQKGHTIHFISYALPFRLKEFSQNIYYHEVDTVNYPLFEFTPYSITLASKMAQVVSYEKLDLLHVHYAIPHATSAILAKDILSDQNDPMKRVKIITTLHGTDITLVGTEPSLSGAVRLGINKSDGVTAVSEYLKQKTIDDFKPTREIEVIPNFINTSEFKRKNYPQFRPAIAKPDEKVIIHISNFRPLKRLKDVVNAFNIINEKIPSRLLLVGDGPERTEAEHLSRELGLAERVKFLGKQEAVIDLLSIADLMLMPSESESFGLAALEAMSCGVPVIAADVGGLPEFIKHEENGYLVQVGDTEKMAEYALSLFQNQTRFDTLRQSARNTAVEYETSEIVTRYENYYDRIISN
ncbi:MAG: N-acetyl-alpha-D-glucosaminyl L-malate synthase BshA [Chloroherpetonaceae bacterium]|nr:N-acetyl-alpha-D-glucosaminyl L-malate synthase BshA [Chloroherpetonaceae bacterium]